MILRGIVVLLVAVLLALQVVRTAAVQRPLPRSTIGARMWAMHPAVITDRTMAEIGASARRGEGLSPATVRQVEEIAERSPLAAEPFLINGAVAQARGDEVRAERLFEEARSRDPRSEAARYFLADRYLRSGRTAAALSEMAVFAKLVPTALVQFAPALAQFAHTPGVVPQMRHFFQSSPEFEPLVLSHLAADVRNADLILALASSGGRQQPWQAQIVGALVEQGQFERAHAVWKKIAGIKGSAAGIFNPQFENIDAPPPFNWTFATSGGVAEPDANGRLQVIYYGREDAGLARQLLLLGPGQYRLGMEVNGQPGDGSAVAWSTTCLPGKQVIFNLPLKHGQRAIAGAFVVPQRCPAQLLELIGSIGEFPQSIDFTIGKLQLIKAAGR